MRPKSHVSLLDSPLRLRRPAARLSLPAWSRCCRHGYASTGAAYPGRIAVLGGGVAGLSSAYFVSREFPNSKITLIEASKETGGWIRSRRVPVPGGGSVVFESGPRTLRNARPTAHLVQELGLIKDVSYTSLRDPAAQNRYIYYPDRLNRLPTTLPSLSEVFALSRSGILRGSSSLLVEPTRAKRASSVSDETVGMFLSRRMDKRLANNIVSAVFHGIYAGDIWQLSAKTLLALPWQLEGRYGSVMGGIFRLQVEDQGPNNYVLANPYDVEALRAMRDQLPLDADFLKALKSASTFTFEDGLQQLVRALQDSIEATGNVEVKVSCPVQDMEIVDDGSLRIAVISGNEPSTQTENFDLVISTLREETLTPYVTVMTVNLYYPDPALIPFQGFGYLIPQSVPFEQNPERALGVIFDSCATKGQDSAPGTKLTVMLGGHWWNDWTSYPSQEEGLEMAKSLLRRHLNISAEPLVHHAQLSVNCIPQYTLGYEDRLKEFARGLSTDFKGRLRVVGSQFNGVGVNDCITAAWNMARGLRNQGWKNTSCGLDRVLESRPWVSVPMRSES